MLEKITMCKPKKKIKLNQKFIDELIALEPEDGILAVPEGYDWEAARKDFDEYKKANPVKITKEEEEKKPNPTNKE